MSNTENDLSPTWLLRRLPALVFSLVLALPIAEGATVEVLRGIDGADQQIGRAFDSLTSSMQPNTCVEIPPDAITKATFDHADVTLRMDVVESMVAFNEQEMSATSASGTFKGVQFSAGASDALSQKFSRYNSLARLMQKIVFVQGDAVDSSRVRFKSELERNLYKTDRPGFRKRCGDSFVIGKRYGGRLVYVLEAQSTTDAEQSSKSQSLGLASAAINGGRSVQDAANDLAKVKMLRIEQYRQGSSKATGVQVNDLAQLAKDFETEIREQNHKATYSFLMGDYETVAQNESIVDNGAIDWSRLDTAVESYLKLVEARNNLRYIMRNPSEFGPWDERAMIRRDATVGKALSAAQAWIAKCSAEITQNSQQSATGRNACDKPPRLTSEWNRLAMFPPKRFDAKRDELELVSLLRDEGWRETVTRSKETQIAQLRGKWYYGKDSTAITFAEGIELRLDASGSGTLDRRGSRDLFTIPKGTTLRLHLADMPGHYGDNSPVAEDLPRMLLMKPLFEDDFGCDGFWNPCGAPVGVDRLPCNSDRDHLKEPDISVVFATSLAQGTG